MSSYLFELQKMTDIGQTDSLFLNTDTNHQINRVNAIHSIRRA